MDDLISCVVTCVRQMIKLGKMRSKCKGKKCKAAKNQIALIWGYEVIKNKINESSVIVIPFGNMNVEIK